MKKITTTVAMIFMVMLSVAQVPNYVDTTALRGWYPFNGDANDYSTYGNNGTATGVTSATDRFGTANSAYNFNGSSKIQLNKVAPLWTLPGHSISVWINKNSTNNGVIFTNYSGLRSGSTLYDATYFELTSDPKWFSNFGNFGPPNNYSGTGSTSFTPGTWYHLVFVRGYPTTAYSYRLYVDGKLVNDGGVGNSPDQVAAAQYNCIGARNASASTPQTPSLDGKLDDMGFWQRILSSCEIFDLYYGSKNGVIATQPANANVVQGATAQFTVASRLGANFQWEQNSGAGWTTLSNAGQYTGVNTNTLSVSNTNLALNNNQLFRCRISLGNGGPASGDTCTVVTNQVTLTVTTTSGIQDVNSESAFRIYPNPVKGWLFVETDKAAAFTIKNIMGQTVLTTEMEGSGKIDVSSIAPGVYFISNPKCPLVNKFVKE